MQDKSKNPGGEWFKRKANQHWEMAGLAAQDGDITDYLRHTKLAKIYDQGLVPEKENNDDV